MLIPPQLLLVLCLAAPVSDGATDTLRAEEHAAAGAVLTTFFDLFTGTEEELAQPLHSYARELAVLLRTYQDGVRSVRAGGPLPETARAQLAATLERWQQVKDRLPGADAGVAAQLASHAEAVQGFVRLHETALEERTIPAPVDMAGGSATYHVPADGGLAQVFARARAGEVIQVEGVLPHAALVRAKDGGLAPVVIRGPAVLQANPTGGSDTLNVKDTGPVHFQFLTLEPDDRAAVMFETRRRYPGVHFSDVKIGLASGQGWNAETDSGFRGKWGVLSYQLDDFRFEGGEVVGIGKEHCFYHHNPNARDPGENAILIRGALMKWARRTAVQVVSRAGEGPPGRGNVTVEECTIEDVCLEDGGGGSALTFRGNLNGTVTIRNTRVHLGGNPNLHPRLGRNITGALVMDTGQGSEGRATRELVIEGCHFEIGPHFTGQGSARRNNVDVGDVGTLRIERTTILNHPGSAAALHLRAGSIRRIILDAVNDVRGDCVLEGLGSYPDPKRDGAGYRAMIAAIRAGQQDKEHPAAELLARIEVTDSGNAEAPR